MGDTGFPPRGFRKVDGARRLVLFNLGAEFDVGFKHAVLGRVYKVVFAADINQSGLRCVLDGIVLRQRPDQLQAAAINIGRLLPQSVYYFYAYAKLAQAAAGEPIVFSIPSGNFGDMMANPRPRRAGSRQSAAQQPRP